MYSMEPLPSVAFTGTNVKMWPGGQWRSQGRLPHTSVTPIVRQALETEIRNQIAAAAAESGIPPKLVIEKGKWREYTELDEKGDHLVVEFTSESFMWIEKERAQPPVRAARWEGGPRHGQEVLASNGQIVWDGPLGVLVQGLVVRWRDVGDGTRAAWDAMSPAERAEYRREIEEDAEVSSSFDVDDLAPPPEYTPPPAPNPDSPLTPIYDEVEDYYRKHLKREDIARAYGVPPEMLVSATAPKSPAVGDIWVALDESKWD